MENYNHKTTGKCGCNERPPRSMQHSCSMKSDSLMNMPVAMAYVPWQFFRDVYEPDKALQCGTIFPELNKPFFGKGGCPR